MEKIEDGTETQYHNIWIPFFFSLSRKRFTLHSRIGTVAVNLKLCAKVQAGVRKGLKKKDRTDAKRCKLAQLFPYKIE